MIQRQGKRDPVICSPQNLIFSQSSVWPQVLWPFTLFIYMSLGRHPFPQCLKGLRALLSDRLAVLGFKLTTLWLLVWATTTLYPLLPYNPFSLIPSYRNSHVTVKYNILLHWTEYLLILFRQWSMLQAAHILSLSLLSSFRHYGTKRRYLKG